MRFSEIVGAETRASNRKANKQPIKQTHNDPSILLLDTAGCHVGPTEIKTRVHGNTAGWASDI